MMSSTAAVTAPARLNAPSTKLTTAPVVQCPDWSRTLAPNMPKPAVSSAPPAIQLLRYQTSLRSAKIQLAGAR